MILLYKLHDFLEIAKKVGIVSALLGLIAAVAVFPHGCQLDLAWQSFPPQDQCRTLTGMTSLSPADASFLDRFEISFVAFAAVAFGTYLVLWIIKRITRSLRAEQSE